MYDDTKELMRTGAFCLAIGEIGEDGEEESFGDEEEIEAAMPDLFKMVKYAAKEIYQIDHID